MDELTADLPADDAARHDERPGIFSPPNPNDAILRFLSSGIGFVGGSVQRTESGDAVRVPTITFVPYGANNVADRLSRWPPELPSVLRMSFDRLGPAQPILEPRPRSQAGHYCLGASPLMVSRVAQCVVSLYVPYIGVLLYSGEDR